MQVKTIDEILVKNIHIIHIKILTNNNVFIGLDQSPHFEITIHQNINAKLNDHQINHHVCTETNDNQYGSINDINTHPRKLLNIEKNIKPKSHEIPEIIFIVPIISIFFHSFFWCEKSSIGNDKKSKWIIRSNQAIIVIQTAHHIHKNQIVNQLKTDTIQKDIPFVIHKIPFALSRFSSSKSKVIIVDIATIRIFQIITPNIIKIIKIRKYILEAYVKNSKGKYINKLPANIKKRNANQVEISITIFFL